MKGTTLYRIAAVIFLVFALGHTYGFLSLRAPSTEGRAVFDGMNTVQFVVHGRTYSYGGFYRGFGLSCTMSMLFSAFLAWQLGELARSAPRAINATAWAFAAFQLSGVIFSVMYFGPAPAVFSALQVIILGWAAVLLRRAVPAF
jgi:hypothetical protein